MKITIIFALLTFQACYLGGQCRPNTGSTQDGLGGTASADSSAAAAVDTGSNRQRRPPVIQNDSQPENIPQIQILTPPAVNPQVTVIHPDDSSAAGSAALPPTGIDNQNRQGGGIGVVMFGSPNRGGSSASASSSASSFSGTNAGNGNALASANSASSANVLGKGNASASSSSSAVAVGK